MPAPDRNRRIDQRARRSWLGPHRRGREHLRAWKPEDGREKWFCGACGSSLFSCKPGFADPVGIRMGVFDTDPGIRPSASFFVASAAPWEPIPDDGLPRFAAKRRSPR